MKIVCLESLNSLPARQISSFFSRLAAKSRNNIIMDGDIRAFEQESYFSTARRDIILHFQMEHPTFDALVDKGTLQSLCESFELETPAKRVRSREPYLSLLEEIVSSCCCSGSSDKKHFAYAKIGI